MAETTETMLHGDTDSGGGHVEEPAVVEQQTADIAENVSAEPATSDDQPGFRLPDDLASDPRFDGVDSVEALARKYAELPTAPKDIEAYKSGLDGLDDNTMGGFRKASLEAGMTVKQYDKMVEYYNGATKRAQEAMNAHVDKYVESVKNEWGDQFDANVRTANQAVAALDTDGGLRKLLSNPAIGNHPTVLKMFHRIGTMISEDSLHTGDAPAGSINRQPEQGGVKYFKSYDKTMEN